MGTMLEIGRNALEGVEVLLAFCTVAALGAGMVFGRHADLSDRDDPAAQPRG